MNSETTNHCQFHWNKQSAASCDIIENRLTGGPWMVTPLGPWGPVGPVGPGGPVSPVGPWGPFNRNCTKLTQFYNLSFKHAAQHAAFGKHPYMFSGEKVAVRKMSAVYDPPV